MTLRLNARAAAQCQPRTFSQTNEHVQNFRTETRN